MYQMAVGRQPVSWGEIEKAVEQAELEVYRVHRCSPVFRFNIAIEQQGGALKLYLWVENTSNREKVTLDLAVFVNLEEGTTFGSAVDDILTKLEDLWCKKFTP